MRRRDAKVAADTPAQPSKTSRKKDMHALQSLGESLVDLDPARLAEIGLPERLADAIRAARTISKHEGRRRQLQFVGRLMREVDPAPIRAALERLGAVSRAERARFSAAERWRDRLIEDESALDEFVAAHADVDRVRLVTMVREARAERLRCTQPHQFRALFRFVSGAIAKVPADESS